MRQWLLHAALALLAFGLFFAGRWDDEGMWLLNSIDKLPLAPMKQHGLELTPQQIYSATKPSLKDAIILLGGIGYAIDRWRGTSPRRRRTSLRPRWACGPSAGRRGPSPGATGG